MTTLEIRNSPTRTLRDKRTTLRRAMRDLDPRFGLGATYRRTLRRIEIELESRDLNAQRRRLNPPAPAARFARSQVFDLMRGGGRVPAPPVPQHTRDAEAIVARVKAGLPEPEPPTATPEPTFTTPTLEAILACLEDLRANA